MISAGWSSLHVKTQNTYVPINPYETVELLESTTFGLLHTLKM